MFYRRRSVFCRLCLNSKTFTHTAFLTHTNHATHAKISTHVTHAKILWTHATHTKISTPTTTSPTPKCYGPTLPTPPTHPRHPCDLADSMSSISPDLYEEILWKAIGFKSLRVNCSDVTQVISKMQNVNYC